MAILTPGQTYVIGVIGGLTVLLGIFVLAAVGGGLWRLSQRDACEACRALKTARRRLRTTHTIDDLKE
ncbi:hypothetical protein [Streptomyces sp. NBC_00996]|uniref:hypothetical protein n=1 Tax=Streptomyces sp. NBC_00996 TaxID=2903710 RepID=UPI00386AB9F1|nr:hypothetical protein OG390_17400 [Streptomyces sp. NBC_00996]